MNLNNWMIQAKDHWRRFQPTEFKELVETGKLNQALQQAADLTHREMTELEQAGHPPQEAWEMVRERYLFPPEKHPEKEPNSPWGDLYREAIEANNQAAEQPTEAEQEE